MPKKEEEEEISPLATLLILLIFGIAAIWIFVPHVYLYVSLIIIVAVFIIATYFAYTKKGIFLPTKLIKSIWNWYKREHREWEKRERRISRKRRMVQPPSRGQINRLIVDIAHNKCEINGCNSEIGLQIHHIIPRSEGGRNKDNNMIVLCVKHHDMADRGDIPRDRLKYIIKKRKK